LDSGTKDLLEKLAVGPSFLLLGQATAELATGEDELLAKAAKEASVLLDHPSFASAKLLDAESRSSLYQALAAQSMRSTPPHWLAEVARHPWNGVFTSSIDGRVLRAFEADWRRVVPVVGTDQLVRHPRSTSELKVRMLFGGVTLPEEQGAPLDQLQLAMRSREARAALDELPAGLLTPRGVLAVDGYRVWDWLEPAALFALATQLRPGQVHLFSVDSDLLADPFLAAAVERGALVAHTRSLSAVLDEAEAAGRLFRPAAVTDLEARVVRLDGRLVELPRDTWNSVIGTARPVDEGLLRPAATASAAIRYQQFRAFVGSSEGAPPWTAIASGMAFERDFEAGLWDAVKRDLVAAQVPGPLIVSGQSGSGKSTALASLAVRAAREGEAAVLFIARRADRPQVDALDAFALWAEEHGAVATLVIWDGMTLVDEYFNAHRQLRALGRRVLLVGSAYYGIELTERTIAIPARLTLSEAERIPAWLNAFEVHVEPEDVPFIAADASFLAALYRLLPESRRALQAGLGLELRSAEAGMERIARALRDRGEDRELGIMAAALSRAGWEMPLFEEREREVGLEEVTFADRSTAERLTGLVLVAGRRNLRIPLDLVLRVLGRDGSTAVVEVVKQFDIIRWSDDESGDQYLGTRTALEAELLARSDLRDVREEVRVITTLLAEVRPRPGFGGPEVQFAVDLLARLGPRSEDKARFVRHYPEISQALRELRLLPARAHSRLMLIEANLGREWVMWAKDHEELQPESRLQALQEAEDVLERAIDLAPQTGRARLTLLVELASVLGAQAYELSAAGVPTTELQSLTKRIVDRTLAARAIDPEDYYPVDVIAWVCLRLSDREALAEGERIGLVADSVASLASIDEQQLSPHQQAKYHLRQEQFARLLGEPGVAEHHLQRLAENEDPAAYFLLALRESGLLQGELDMEGAKRALQRLMEGPPTVREDWRCARLILDLFWLTRTGRRFLQGEREALAFAQRDWEDCLDLTAAIAGSSAFDQYRVDFLKGLALFHLGQLRQALAIFRSLDRSTMAVSRRIIATYVASSPDGTAATFTGQVRTVTPDGRRGSVWVSELGIELPFIPYRFPADLERGDALPEFHIAFNLRGAIADPIRAAQPRRNARTE
jgi:hypothetical protein